MSRKLLNRAIRLATEREGYAFYSGFEYMINSECKDLPALWLLPPVLSKVSGRKEGRKFYQVNIRMLCNSYGSAGSAKEELWNTMEDAFSRIILEICCDEHIRNVTGLKYTPSEYTLTNIGEVSLSVSFTAEMNFKSE